MATDHQITATDEPMISTPCLHGEMLLCAQASGLAKLVPDSVRAKKKAETARAPRGRRQRRGERRGLLRMAMGDGYIVCIRISVIIDRVREREIGR